MEQRVSLLTLGVKDLAKSAAFYENVLGWKRAETPPGIVFFQLNGVILGLFPFDELAKDHGGKPGAAGGFSVAYNARDRQEVDQIFADLKKKGVTITKPPEEVFWGGYSGYFDDLDGHHWEVAHNPFWTIGADGRMSMKPPG